MCLNTNVGSTSALTAGTTIRVGVTVPREASYDQAPADFLTYANTFMVPTYRSHDLRYVKPLLDKRVKLMDYNVAKGSNFYVNELIRVNKSVMYDDIGLPRSQEHFLTFYGDMGPPAGGG